VTCRTKLSKYSIFKTNRYHYGRTGHCRAPKSHGKGDNPLGKAFAVRPCTAKFARQRSGRQSHLCRASRKNRTAKPLPSDLALPCAAQSLPSNMLCRVPTCFAVRPSLPCASPPARTAKSCSLPCASPQHRTAKDPTATPGGSAVHSWAAFAVRMCTAKTAFAVPLCLCRVHVHGKGAENIPAFCCFRLIPAHIIHKIDIYFQIHI
jgi:hypothetical protein